MPIDRRGGCVQPYPGRVCQLCDNAAQQLSRENPGVIDRLTVFGGVATVDTAPGEIDANVCAFEILGPEARSLAVPMNCLPLGCMRTTCQNGDVMTLFLKMSRKDLSNLATSAGNYDSQGTCK